MTANFTAKLSATGHVTLTRNGKLVATVPGGEAEADAYVDAYMDGLNVGRAKPFTMWTVTYQPAAMSAANA